MSKNITNAIVPVRHEEVTVIDSTVLVALNEEGRGFFSPRHVCDALGIDWNGQRVKIMADPVLSTTVEVISTVAADGKQRAITMLPIEFLSGWLFTIKKVAPAIQDKLNRFRLEGCLALDAWFRQGLRNNPVVQEVVQVPMSYKEALYELIKKEEENERLLAENAKKDAALAVAQPKAEVFDAQVASRNWDNLIRFARRLRGVNTLMIKSDLLRLEYLYQFKNEKTYRIYAKYRDVLFVEKLHPKSGKSDIYLTPKGMEEIVKLYKQGKLTMKSGFSGAYKVEVA